MSINNILSYVLLAETAYVDFSGVDFSKDDKVKDAIAEKDLGSVDIQVYLNFNTAAAR